MSVCRCSINTVYYLYCAIVCYRCFSVLLACCAGHDVFESGGSVGSMQFSADVLSTVDLAQYRVGTFHLLLAVAMSCAVVQLMCWARFSLRDQWLSLVKQARLHPGFTVV